MAGRVVVRRPGGLSRGSLANAACPAEHSSRAELAHSQYSGLAEERTGRDGKRFSDIDQTFIEQAAFTVFDIDQDITGHTRGQRQLFLCQALA